MIKRRGIALILSLAMAITMTPMMGAVAYADDSQVSAPAAMVMGTDVLAEGSNTADAPTVYMADKAWRVIGYGGAGVASSEGTMTLISSGNLKTGVQFRGDRTVTDANHYSKSNLISEVNEVADKFSDKERAGIVARTLESGGYEGKDTDCIAGDPINSAVLWPLSIKEAGAMSKELRIVESEGTTQPADWNRYWWLRSPGGNGSMYAGAVKDTGDIPVGLIIGFPVDNQYGLRPAFNYDLDSVIFTSSATGGKISGEVGDNALTQVETNEGSEWKLTVKDADHQNFSVTSVADLPCNSDEASISYSGAATGENEYISAIIKDKNGKIAHYGRLAEATEASGTVEAKINGKLGTGDTLYIFNEQVNGDKKTDYSSELYEIKIKYVHKLTKTDQVDPTCTGSGTEAYWTCDTCKKMFSDEAAVAEITEPVAIPAKGHSWDAGKVTKKPAITATGIRTYTCTVCEATKAETIAKLPKKNNTLKIKAKTAKVKYKKLKKKTQKLAVTKVIKFTKKGQGKMTYKLVSAKKGKKSFKKYVKINKTTGKVTIKKNKKMKKGTYKVKVRAKASGTATYKASGWKTVTFKIKVK